MLHHIVQEDMYGEFGFHRLIAAFKELGSSYGVIKIVPFSHEVQHVTGLLTGGMVPTMVWGMTTVEEVAKLWGWNPGVFKNDNFNMKVLHEKFGTQMLNADGKFYKLGEVPPFEGTAFIRPVLDTKSFTGMLINGEELETWRKQLYELRREFTTLDLNTEVLVASPKKIIDEARFFVVDNRVVAGSTYRVGGRVLYKSIDSQNPLFLQMRKYAEAHTTTFDHWRPAEAFVLDIGRIEPGDDWKNFRIIEVNCLNSSGFYDSDMRAVVSAIENLHRWPERWGEVEAPRPPLDNDF